MTQREYAFWAGMMGGFLVGVMVGAPLFVWFLKIIHGP